jgi:hypothetical protein
MNKSRLDVEREINQILRKTKKILRINKYQNQQRIMFDMLSAVDEASVLLKEAWDLSVQFEIVDNKMREDFTDMFYEFGEIKRNIGEDLRYKN